MVIYTNITTYLGSFLDWVANGGTVVKGNFDAQFNIASRYAGGQGVEVNLIEAYFWFSTAAKTTTALNKERVRQAIEMLEQHMNEENIQIAKDRLQNQEEH